MAEKMTGAQSLVRSLEHADARVVFGIPGGAILPAYDPLMDSTKVRHILVRHEQGGGHAAQGYAAASGRVGVCMATSGPGATNLVTPIADAHMDSIPLVAITGQVSSAAIGSDAFQEADIRGITMPITKHNYLVIKAHDIPRAIKEAARLIVESKRPVFYVGGGVIRARASKELRQLAELTGIPVVTTLMARGAFPDSHVQHMGMPGMHGSVGAVGALQQSDLLITLGARFDDRVTGKLSSFAPRAKVIHVDIDPAEISKNRAADIPIVADVREAIIQLIPAITSEFDAGRRADLTAWWKTLNNLRETYPLGYETPSDGTLAPQLIIERLGKIAGPDAIYASGVGQHQMWAAQFIGYENPNTWLNSGGLGTMGFSVPAAMGAKVAKPDTAVWAIDGDGCFQMTNQELATCTINNIPIKVALINNSSLGMVRQWQTLFYNERYSNTDLHSHSFPDFVKLADAYGCLGLRVTETSEIDKAIETAMETNDRPVVIDFRVHRDAMVWPMVAAGVSNDEIQFARDLAPKWEREAE